MSTPQPSAATRAPAPTRNARASPEETVAKESLYAHAKRSFRSAISGVVTAVLDAGIGLLQRLRKLAGGAPDAGNDGREDERRPRRDQPGGRRDAAAAPVAEVEAPKPKRRLRAFLVYLSVLLVGGMGGGVLAYDLLQELLNQQFEKSGRLEALVSTHSKSAATTQQELKEAQTRRIEAEKKLHASIADYTKSATEKQDKLDAVEKRLETMLAAERASHAPRLSPVNRSSPAHKPPPLKTGKCDLHSGNIAALKDCIEDFNR